MMRSILVLCCLSMLGCLSTTQYAMMYFRQTRSTPSFESPDAFFERVDATRSVRQKFYGDARQAKEVEQCSLFRNQLFVASLRSDGGEAGKEVQAVASNVERAYQNSEEEFMRVCKIEKNTPLGQIFLAIQSFYGG